MDSILRTSSRVQARISQSQDPILLEIESAYRNRLLHDVSRSAAAFVLPLSVLYVVALISHFSWQTAVSVVLVALLVPIALLVRSLARRGSTTAGGRLFLVSHIVVIIANAWLIDGLFKVVAAPLIIFVTMAGMIMGTREAYRWALASSILWLLTRTALTLEMVSPQPLPGVMAEVVGDVVILSTFVFVAILGHLSQGSSLHSFNAATWQLRQTNRALEKASKQKSQFTARTSHELRTPLGAIMVFADLMLRRAYGPLTAKQEDSLKRVVRSAKRLNELVDDILDLSRIEAGQLEIANRPVNLQQILENVASTLEPQAKEKGLKLEFRTSSQLPAAVLGDERRLTQVLINLVDNAIKFTDEGKVTASLEPLYRTHWKIIVCDTGHGIHEENLERVFRPFQRDHLGTKNAQVPGTGLGLSITRHLVEMMGGRIHLESVVDRGSCFEIILPLRVPNANANDLENGDA